VNIPNFTPKSVSRMDISAFGVVLKPVSPNKLNLRYLEYKSSKFSIMKCTVSSARHLIHFEDIRHTIGNIKTKLKEDERETVMNRASSGRWGRDSEI
jgi:hypothetical protein